MKEKTLAHNRLTIFFLFLFVSHWKKDCIYGKEKEKSYLVNTIHS